MAARRQVSCSHVSNAYRKSYFLCKICSYRSFFTCMPFFQFSFFSFRFFYVVSRVSLIFLSTPWPRTMRLTKDLLNRTLKQDFKERPTSAYFSVRIFPHSIYSTTIFDFLLLFYYFLLSMNKMALLNSVEDKLKWKSLQFTNEINTTTFSFSQCNLFLI
jgi:hypothetical protein